MSIKLSRITKINPREIWKHEAIDFTQWLAHEENIPVLCEELELNLENVKPEAAAGRYNVDLVADNTVSELKLLQKEFWDNLKEHAPDHQTTVNFGRTPKPQHWYNISFGTSRCHIALTLNTQKGYVGCEIYIHNDKALLDTFHKNQASIEKEIGEPLEWMKLPDATASRILLTYNGNPKERSRWEEYFNWYITTVEKFSIVFKQYV